MSAHSPVDVIAMQQLAGNRAVSRSLASAGRPDPRSPAAPILQRMDISRTPVVQRIPAYSEWQKLPGNADKTPQAWIDEAIKEFKTLYLQATGTELTNKSTPPESLNAVVTRFVSAAKKATNDEAARLRVVSAVNELRSLVPSIRIEMSQTALRTSELGVLSEESSGIAHRILSFLPLSSLVKVRATNRYLRYLADTTLVFSMRGPDGKSTLRVRLEHVNEAMKDTSYEGLHGSSVSDSAGLYSGLTERPAEKDRVYKTSQLGPGFYLTEGKGPSERDYAVSVAKERARATGTGTAIFRVFINMTEAVTYEVPKKDWADMEHDKVPESLRQLCLEPKLLTSAIIQNEPTRQIKVNPALFSLVRVLPPLEAMDTEFTRWVEAYAGTHPFDFGSIEYDY